VAAQSSIVQILDDVSAVSTLRKDHILYRVIARVGP